MPQPLSGYATKTQALSAHLTEMAHQLGAGAKLPTMQQLSVDLGISVMTLNRALSELEAQGIVVWRQGSGTYVGEKVGQKSIGLVYDRDVFGPGTSPFCGLLLHEAQRRAEEHGEQFSLFLAAPSPSGLPVHQDLADAIENRRLTGLLFAGESNPAALKWLLKQKLPLVALSYAPITTYRVRIHHAQTVYLGAQELARRGCQNIALWIPEGVGIGRESGAESFEELDFFKRALEDCNIVFRPELVLNSQNLTATVPPQPPQTNQQQGHNAAHEVFADTENRPDGIVILDDMMTRGALAGLSQIGIKCGQDVQIASHTNKGSHLLFGFEEQLILLEIAPAEIAATMFEMLETLMRGEKLAQNVVSIAPRVVTT